MLRLSKYPMNSNTSRAIPHLLATLSSINGLFKSLYLMYDTTKIISLLELNCWYTLSRVCVSEGYARAEQTMYRVTRPPQAIVSSGRWMWKGGCPTSNFSSHRLWESGGWPSLWKVRDTFPLFSRWGTPFAGRDGFKLSTAVSREKKCFTYSFSSGLPITLALPLRARVGGGG